MPRTNKTGGKTLPCTTAEKKAVSAWLNHCEDLATQTIARMKQVPRENRPDFWQANIEHWEKVRSAILWSLGLNQNRKAVDHVSKT